MQLNKLENIYFVGIGGIGMSALARYFNAKGVKVWGYDKTPTPLTQALENEGMQIIYDENIPLPEVFSVFSEKNTVVYTPAIPKDNRILLALQQNYQVYKRAQILGFLSGEITTLAVAGTHGKTTTSILLTHLLQSANVPVLAFLGGIAKNFNSNMVLNNQPQYMVTEADEFDRSFLTLFPEIAVITSVDADHLDIYNNTETIEQAYRDFASQTKQLITKPELTKKLNHTNCCTYSIQHATDARLLDYRVENHSVKAKFQIEKEVFEATLNYPGLHNAENTLAAAYVAYKTGVDIQAIIKGIETFQGVKRRFEFHIKEKDLIMIDDYAHHPAEITATLNAVRQLYSGQPLTVIFQPHLYSRTRDFRQEFAQALAIADKVAVLPVYPARELPIEGVSSNSIVQLMDKNKASVIQKNQIEDFLINNRPTVLVTMGAGDIDKELTKIKSTLLKLYAANE